MPSNIRYAGLAILAAMIIGPIIGVMSGLAGAVVVMILIGVIGFSTVVLVMMIGLVEDEHPHTAEESAAVQAWSKRLASQSNQQASPTETTEASADEDSDS